MIAGIRLPNSLPNLFKGSSILADRDGPFQAFFSYLIKDMIT